MLQQTTSLIVIDAPFRAGRTAGEKRIARDRLEESSRSDLEVVSARRGSRRVEDTTCCNCRHLGSGSYSITYDGLIQVARCCLPILASFHDPNRVAQPLFLHPSQACCLHRSQVESSTHCFPQLAHLPHCSLGLVRRSLGLVRQQRRLWLQERELSRWLQPTIYA